MFSSGRPVSAAFFKRPVWKQTIGKQSNERPSQKNSAAPEARYSESLTLSILRVKNSLPLTVSADTTTPRSLSLETRPLISCLRYALPNRRPGDCKMGVGGNKWAHTGHLFSHTSCFTTSHGGKVFARRFQIASAIFKHSKRKANRIAGFAPEASPVCDSFSRSCP